jgi:predicted AlkP superfamily pyrophosphatase or phosphodiesterase
MRHSIRRMIWMVAVAIAVTAAAAAGRLQGAEPVRLAGEPPRLVVVISIDQFRADYLTRFADLYLPAGGDGDARHGRVGGFRYLMERGAYFTDAHHDHYPLYTGPGHSVLLTGAPPYKSGIVGNSWYDRGLGRRRYCVEDPDSPLVGIGSAPAPGAGAAAPAMGAAPPRAGISPATLRVDTVSDELKMATGGRAKVWGLAFKDRAAVLMAGHLADGVLWFDDETGAWITSRFYRPDDTLPGWVAALNAEHRPDAWFGKEWLLSVPDQALARLWTPGNRWAVDPSALGTGFPHLVNGGQKQVGRDFYSAFATTPFGNDFVLDSARELIRHEKLGQGDVPDLLAINLSSNDYVGHAFGPDSPEVLDISVRTDRQLAAFFDFLDHAVLGGLARVTLAVSADHGVAPIPGAAREAHLPAGNIDEAELVAAANRALAAAYGPGDWVTALVESNLYLNQAALDSHKLAREPAEALAAAALESQPGIYAAYTRTQILQGRLPATDIGARIARSFHPKASGDVVLVTDPFWMPGKPSGTTHGTPYAYDTAVPLLLAGARIHPGRFTARVSTLDLAPTLADLLGILQPAGNEGHILGVALAGAN